MNQNIVNQIEDMLNTLKEAITSAEQLKEEKKIEDALELIQLSYDSGVVITNFLKENIELTSTNIDFMDTFIEKIVSAKCSLENNQAFSVEPILLDAMYLIFFIHSDQQSMHTLKTVISYIKGPY